MHHEIIFSGFGGQGALFAGQVLAYAAMAEGKYVTWIPSYGPEMRGGTAHCTVIVSDEEIGSPLVRRPSAAVVLNIPSMDHYEPLVETGGLLVVNSSLISRLSSRSDIRVLQIPANDIALEIGDAKLANVVLLGALIGGTGVVALETVFDVLAEHLPEKRRYLLEPNITALKQGFALAQEMERQPALGD